MRFKHQLAMFLAITVLMLSITTAPVTADQTVEFLPIAPESYVDLRLGEVNGDKTIDSSDALEMLQYAVQLRDSFSGDPLFWEVADTNGDGKVSANDALEVLQYAVKKRTLFSVQEAYDYLQAEPGVSSNQKYIEEQYDFVYDFFEKSYSEVFDYVDSIIEESNNTYQASLDLAAICCCLYLTCVPYVSPYFNQTPVWHAQRLKEIAKIAPERVEELFSSIEITSYLLLEDDTFLTLYSYGAFAFPYAADRIFSDVRLEKDPCRLLLSRQNLWHPQQHYCFYQLFYFTYPYTPDGDMYRIINEDKLYGLGNSNYGVNKERDDGWPQFLEAFGDNFIAVREWCGQ